jgi:hypothetical protein
LLQHISKPVSFLPLSRVVPLQRDTTGMSDWTDAQGMTYDAVGPVPAGRLNLRAFLRQVDKHLLKQGLDRVVIDLTGFPVVERGAVFTHLWCAV